MRHLLLSFLGSGNLRPAPGTWGSLAALPAAWIIYLLGGPFLLLALSIVLFLAGTKATQIEIETGDNHDPSWVVIDEVVGQWIALFPVAFGAWATGHAVHTLWPGILMGFLLFRLFDITKPWLVGQADRRGDALGVMLDDVWAGIFAAIIVAAAGLLAHSVFL